MPKIVILWTDAALFLIVASVMLYAWRARRSPATRATWAQVGRSAPAMCAAVVLTVFALVALLDSLHYRPLLPPEPGVPDAQGGVTAAPPAYAPMVKSVLDALLEGGAFTQAEKTYSMPLATRQFTKETLLIDGAPVRDFPRLRFGGAHLDAESAYITDIFKRLFLGLLLGLALAMAVGMFWAMWRFRKRKQGEDFSATDRGSLRLRVGTASLDLVLKDKACALARGQDPGLTPGLPWRAMWLTLLALCLAGGALVSLAGGYHPLGTDRTGNDVLWQAIKSIRTALVIGSLTTLAMLPPALGFGIAAGYFKGHVDDAIQYLYTTLTAIPGVLLIAACVLMMQVYLNTHPEWFPTSAQRADLRLFLLCMILGLTGWAGLCRLLRAESLKLRELEYVQAARAFGVSHWGIMRRHLLPNLMHVVLITAVLEFSGLVLYEAVLSYLGIGVDPSMHSFGSMIDMARLEMSRDPMIWWNLATAFAFLLALVLSANIFADAVRDAFDPRARKFLPAAGPTRAVPPSSAPRTAGAEGAP